MFFRKLQFQLKNIFNKFAFLKAIPKIELSMDSFILLTITCILSFVLFRGIYLSISDIDKYRLYEIEKQKLEELDLENKKLNQRKEYFESKYYETLYARQAFNLAKENQEIYFIERRGLYDFSSQEKKGQEINLDNYRSWWIKLLL